ncbi:transmembrane signal receptor [Lithospermum erythrorhizon]|uniref:Transmembrane signal receptor n=1 Tax=Lithospermum erythrorhizon TaxID=34254 RepID=A0AAV3RQE2_LITER
MLSMAQFLPLLQLLSSTILFIPGIHSLSNFTVMNNCNYTIWPGIMSNTQVKIATTGFILQKGESKLISVPFGWTGRFWGRTNCSENSTSQFSCFTGDCGSGKLECSSRGSIPPTTMAEFAINAANNVDYYDVSVVDGYNLPMAVVPLGGTNCTTIMCSISLNDTCPSELKVMSSDGDVVACNNACLQLKQRKFCDNPTLYSGVFKKACPTAYSYALDDSTSTYTCAAGVNYAITFCPLSDGTASTTPPQTPKLAPPPYSPPPPGNGGLPPGAIVAVVMISFAIIFLIVIYCFLRRKGNKHTITIEATGDVHENEISEAESLQYDLSIIKAATNNFSPENKIGEGGFGEVFKGTLSNGQQVAVKRLSKSSGQGEQDFKNEVLLVAKLQHRNLVKLLGLDCTLFDHIKQEALDWSRRYKIIGGVARGILYLHEDSRLRIIHRDIKASNVLLDKDMNAKISDFGLARIVGLEESQGNTSRVVGTHGYMSPEYIQHGHFSIKSDVFSFGVLVLEIISGKTNNSFYQSSDNLLSHAWKLWKDGKPLDLVDPALADSFDKKEVTRCIHIGLLCVQEDLNERPTMASVVIMLNSSSMTLPVAHQPAFFVQGRMMPVSNLPDPVIVSENGVSISELLPR